MKAKVENGIIVEYEGTSEELADFNQRCNDAGDKTLQPAELQEGLSVFEKNLKNNPGSPCQTCPYMANILDRALNFSGSKDESQDIGNRDPKPWMEDDIDMLRELCKAKISLNAIAKALGRRWNNVRDKIIKLGIEYDWNDRHGVPKRNGKSKGNRAAKGPVRSRKISKDKSLRPAIKSEAADAKTLSQEPKPASRRVEKPVIKKMKFTPIKDIRKVGDKGDWNKADIELLKFGNSEGKSPDGIGRELGKTEQEVRSKIHELALEEVKNEGPRRHPWDNIPDELKCKRAY